MGAHERELGNAWAQDCLSRASHTSGSKQETWVAVNPLDPNNVIIGAKDRNPAISADCVWNGIFVTHDGGVSWKDIYISGKYADRGTQSPYYGYACNTDPMGVFGPDGTAHWLIEMYNLGGDDGFGPAGADPDSGRGIVQPGWKLVLAHSHDGGDTWPEGEVTTLEYGDGFAVLNDYSRITVNPVTGAAVTMINTFYPAVGVNAGLVPVPMPVPPGGALCSILVYRPGEPVSKIPVQPTLHTSSANPGNLFCQAIAAHPDGNLTMAAIGGPSPSAGTPAGPAPSTQAWFAMSSDDGATWSDFTQKFSYAPIPGRFAESAYRTGTNFELVYDGRPNGTKAGTLYVAYAANGTAPQQPGMEGGDEADIYVRASADEGLSWGNPVRVNLNVTGHQFMPNLAVAGDGSLHAFFMDKQYDPAHRLIDITYARSDDGGATWTNQRVTNVSFDGDLGVHQEDFPFIGDYIGAGASGDTVWGAFPDASDGKQTVVAAARVKLNP